MDLIGKKIGKLTVIEKTTCKKGKWNVSAYICKCDCGNVKIMRRDYLLSGRARSCGCYRIEAARNAVIKHGMSKCSQFHHPLYDAWSTMIQRCCNPNNKGYKYYGARGINVCDEWRNDFETFYDWAIKNGYKRGLQIDRVDVNYGYIPNNCRWVTTSVQARNKRNTILVEYKGEAICLQDLANKTGLSRSTLLYRYRNNKPLVPEAI